MGRRLPVLAEGSQSIILRKGGIHEGREGFRVEHREFWLFPTQFHQQPEQLTADAEPIWRRTIADAPPAGTIPIALYAVVEQVQEITDEAQLDCLAGMHIWSDATIRERFHYRRAGVFLLLARVYRIPKPHVLNDTPYFAGCRSWVELPETLSTAGAVAALSDERFAAVCQKTSPSAVGNGLRAVPAPLAGIPERHRGRSLQCRWPVPHPRRRIWCRRCRRSDLIEQCSASLTLRVSIMSLHHAESANVSADGHVEEVEIRGHIIDSSDLAQDSRLHHDWRRDI